MFDQFVQDKTFARASAATEHGHGVDGGKQGVKRPALLIVQLWIHRTRIRNQRPGITHAFFCRLGSFDLAYLTEVDPLWNDDELTLILNPDAVLFANPVAVAACAADCVAASLGFGIKEMFWCAGCQGGIYPLNGQVPYHMGGVRTAALLAQRLTAKMHRELLAWGWHGTPGLCGPYFEPVMDKTAYKTQLTYPVPNTGKEGGKCCQPFGRTTVTWGAGKEYPVRGEDFAFMLFRKRNCCVGY